MSRLSRQVCGLTEGGDAQSHHLAELQMPFCSLVVLAKRLDRLHHIEKQ
jgi:hypothetical protein